MTTEIFKPVPGYEGDYEVSNMGNVRSLHYGKVRLLRSPSNSRGYPAVGLFLNRTRTTHLVHWLVMAAFVGERPAGMVINHIDSDKTNNLLSNLEYTSQHHNIQVSSATPLTPENILEIRELLKSGLTQAAIAQRFRVSQRCISYIKRGERWANITSQESAS